MKEPHAADLATIQGIERASYFTVTLRVGGAYRTHDLKTLELARQAKPLLEELHGGQRRALVYAVTPEGFSFLVPDTYNPMEKDMTTLNSTTSAAAIAAAANGAALPPGTAKGAEAAVNAEARKGTPGKGGNGNGGKIPYAGKEPRKNAAKGKGGKLPVPPRRNATPAPEVGKAASTDVVLRVGDKVAAPKKAESAKPDAAKVAAAKSGANSNVAAPAAPDMAILPKGTLVDGIDCSGMTDLAKYAGIPVYLQVQNRKGLSPELKAKVDDMAKKHNEAAARKRDAADKAKAEAQASARAAKKAASKANGKGKGKGKAAKAAKPRKPANGERARYDWTGAEEAAKNGTMPKVPDFSADTHTRFRPSLAEVEKMAKAKDLDGLRKFRWKGALTSSPKAIMRYRAICMTALQAK